jgi:hypothetical protein
MWCRLILCSKPLHTLSMRHGTDFCVGLPTQLSSPGTKIEKYILMGGGGGDERLAFLFKDLTFACTNAE